MKLILIISSFLLFAEVRTQEEKDRVVKGDIFQVNYSLKQDHIELKLSGYDLAEINWKDLSVTAYSLSEQIQDFSSLKPNETLKLKRSLISEPSGLRLRIKYKDKVEDLNLP